MAINLKKYAAVICISLMTGISYAASAQGFPAVVYVGTTACDAYIKQVTGIPAKAECDKIQWKLSLDQSGKYLASLTYGLQEQSGPGFIGGGKSFQIEGNWTNETGTATDPRAKIYRLDRGKDQPEILLVKMDDSILHFLFSDKKFLIGNAGYGYALSRENN
ncbi:MAG: hypothetical protein JWQ30_1057 [Sediminibacterium sp.]|nr:hypothetical protein [Sediminibacterium sp.]